MFRANIDKPDLVFPTPADFIARFLQNVIGKLLQHLMWHINKCHLQLFWGYVVFQWGILELIWVILQVLRTNIDKITSDLVSLLQLHSQLISYQTSLDDYLKIHYIIFISNGILKIFWRIVIVLWDSFQHSFEPYCICLGQILAKLHTYCSFPTRLIF